MIGRTNIRQRLRNNDVVISAMLRFPSPAAMEIMALAGVDLVIIDNEHYPFDEETMIDLVRAADVRGMACAVRVPNAEPTRIAQIMDYGVDGILVPSVDSYEEAMQLVNAVKYAPVGERGFCPSPGGGIWLWQVRQEYAEFANEHSIVMVQIETKEGVADLDRILSIRRSTASTTALDWRLYGKPATTTTGGPRVVRDIITRPAAGKNVGEMAYTPRRCGSCWSGRAHVSIGSDQQIIAAGCKALWKRPITEGATAC